MYADNMKKRRGSRLAQPIWPNIKPFRLAFLHSLCILFCPKVVCLATPLLWYIWFLPGCSGQKLKQWRICCNFFHFSPSPPINDGGGCNILFYMNDMSCLKFDKLVCLSSTRSGKYGSADSKTIIVNSFFFESVTWWLLTGMKLKVSTCLLFVK